MSYGAAPISRSLYRSSVQVFVFPFKIFHWWVNAPTFMFLLALTAMLFRPPDLKIFPIDRIVFVGLIVLICTRCLLGCDRLRMFKASWPLLALLSLGLWDALSQPYDAQVWSVLAAKYLVPLVFFHAAGLVFRDVRSRGILETFLLVVTAYVSVISVFSLIGANSLIFPQFVNDESIGIHWDRARGPFLQAVANGVCLNLLGLIAVDSFRRRKLKGFFGVALFFLLPLAILATKTRAVWISASVSALALVCIGSGRRIRRVAAALCVIAALVAAIFVIASGESDSFADRALDRSPIDFRAEMYQAGWQMFTEKPVFGWGSEWNVQPEVERYVSGFHPEYYIFHNTFLELAVQHGLLGVGLYAWLITCLFRLRKFAPESPGTDSAFSGVHFRAFWPLLLIVYLINATAVVMNYQFVNALLFTIAGILAADAIQVPPVPSLRDAWAAA